jgi:ribosomal protein S6--L-glutamate ligase
MNTNSLLIGWKEWAQLPDLNVPLIKVKVDTGAKTSALHADDIRVIKIDGKEFAEFIIHPIQNNDRICRKAIAEIVGRRNIKSSNGHKEMRLVIRTPIKIGKNVWDIDITLTNRDIMHHRMLLGRAAMGALLVDPTKSYCQGAVSINKALIIYEPVILV